MAETLREISFNDPVRKTQERCFGKSQRTTHKGQVNADLLEFIKS
jgi:hypothetical protein